MDFNKSLFENCQQRPLVCAHRGLSGGNIPCNSMAAFKAAVNLGADIVEIDVTKSRDGELFVFHPGKEHSHLGVSRVIQTRSSASVKKLRYRNFDNVKTSYQVERLEDVLLFLKDKCYINVDKFWDNIPEITAKIRKCGVEKQVIVKTPIKEKYLKLIEQYCPDFMFVPMIRKSDKITSQLIERNINYVGAEALFESADDEVGTKKYSDEMHKKGLILFRNAIVYDEKDVISAGLTDDRAMTGEEDASWGRLIELGTDIIQTDFCNALKAYIINRG